MPSSSDRALIAYRYDALDRLVGRTPAGQPHQRRFYQKDVLVTEIEGGVSYRIFQYQDELLAERHNGRIPRTALLITDKQRSVLQAFDARSVYTPYGHRSVAGSFASLTGFNGERADSTTGHYLLGNGHRAFNPVLMRFNRPDSLSPFGEGGLNSYAYCGGDPVNRRDPTGQFWDWFGWGWLIANIITTAGDYGVPLVPKRVATWIPGVENPTFGRAAKHASQVSGLLAGLSYIPVNLIDQYAFTPQRYGFALIGHFIISAVAVFSAAGSTLHKIATSGRELLPELVAYRPESTTLPTISGATSSPPAQRPFTSASTTAAETANGIRRGQRTTP